MSINTLDNYIGDSIFLFIYFFERGGKEELGKAKIINFGRTRPSHSLPCQKEETSIPTKRGKKQRKKQKRQT